MLEAIRAIVAGRVDEPAEARDAQEGLNAFARDARTRWTKLIGDLPLESASRLPHGGYELAFSIVGGQAARNLVDLQERLAIARRIRLTGWTPFLEMGTAEWRPYPFEDNVEAWVGRPTAADPLRDDPSLADFWRVSREGYLYTIRGYTEDARGRPPGSLFDITLPVWRVGEALLFAQRLAETFEGAETIAYQCRYSGLRGRTLVSLSGQRILFEDRTSETDDITVKGVATLQQIRDNLAEIVHPLLVPLYERFAFFNLPFALVDEELVRLNANRF